MRRTTASITRIATASAVAVGAVANVLAVFGLRERGEKQRLAAQASERRSQRLGQ